VAKKRIGRRNRTPDKLTPEVQKLIVDAVAALAPRKTAAEHAGVTDRAVRYWMARGSKERTGPYHSFFSAIKKAESAALISRIARIGKAGQGGQLVQETITTTVKANGETVTKTTRRMTSPQWQADAWGLERRDPGNYADNRREFNEMKRQLAAIMKAVDDGKLNGTTTEKGKATPKVGGAAKPESI
jgi:hypothetical protein